MSRLTRYLLNQIVFDPPVCEEDCEMWLDDCEEVKIKTRNEVKLNAWYLSTDQPSVYIVSHHGTSDCVCNWAIEADYLRRCYNAAVLIYAYRGYGHSGGTPDMAKITEDGESVVKWLCRREKIKAADLVVHGYSLGGAVAVSLAAKLGTRGLIVEGSFSSIRDMACTWTGGFVIGPLLSKYLNSTAAIKNYHGALLQCHGDADEVIPYELGCKLFDACPSENKTFVNLPGCDHHDIRTRRYRRKQKEFFKSLK